MTELLFHMNSYSILGAITPYQMMSQKSMAIDEPEIYGRNYTKIVIHPEKTLRI